LQRRSQPTPIWKPASEQQASDTMSESEGEAKMKKGGKRKSAGKKEKQSKKSDGKAKRAKKDKNAPKRGRSAYIYFCEAERSEVKASNPNFGFGDIAKELADKWKQLSEDEKKPFGAKADRDKKRYEREKAAYEGKGGAAAADDGD